MKYSYHLVLRQRDKMALTLSQFNLLIFTSNASFLLFDAGSKRAAILAELASTNIAVRDTGTSGTLANCIRVSIGSEIANDCEVQAIAGAVRG